MNIEEKIIMFDGVCNLCNSSVNYIIDKDKKNIFKFASLQSHSGETLIEKSGLDRRLIDSVILYEDGHIYIRSTAVLRIAKHLGGYLKLLYVFIVIPPFIRNFLYDVIAKNRYKWFGKKDSCRIPTPELKEKFLP